MAVKLKPQGPRCKRFEFWTKVAKVTKPQGPKWQFANISMFSLHDVRNELTSPCVLQRVVDYESFNIRCKKCLSLSKTI
ncbi:hypothetical protein Hanom_Chr02g00155531 [Helianthus anomalus]